MRKIILLFVLVTLFACNKNSGTPTTQGDGEMQGESTKTEANKVPTQAEIDSRVHVGTVKSVVQADGPNTTYLEIAGMNSTFWIAVSKTDIKQGDTVKFPTKDAVVMENFKSNALNRNFDRILFVSQIEVVNKKN